MIAPRLTAKRLSLAVLFVVLACSTIVWTMRDKTPPAWDPSDHIRYGYDYYVLLAHGRLNDFAHDFFVAPHFYAPLAHLLLAAVFLVAGASRVSALVVNLISLAVLLASTSSISTRVNGGRLNSLQRGQRTVAQVVAVLAALIASCSHFSAWLMHDAFLDFPLTAAVTAAFALLMRAGDFKNTRFAIEFGVAAGLGMLVKQTFAFFFVVPALFVIVRVLASRDRRAILNLVLAGIVVAAISAVWYVPHFQDVLAIYRENNRAAIDENEAPLLSFDSNFFYIHALLSKQLQMPFAALFVVGVIYSLIRLRRESLLIYLWLAGGIFIFALVANKDIRYTVPIVPAAAVLAVCWLPALSLLKRKGKTIFVLSAVAVALWSFISLFNAQWPIDGMGTYINTPRYQWMVFARNYYGFDHRPSAQDWSVPAIVRTVADLPLGGDGGLVPGTKARSISPKEGASPVMMPSPQQPYPTIGVVVNLPHLNPSSVALYARLLAGGRAAEPLVRVQWLVVDGSLSRMSECDYVLARTGLDQAEWVAPIEREFEKMRQDNPVRFQEVASFEIPLPSANAVIYRVGK